MHQKRTLCLATLCLRMVYGSYMFPVIIDTLYMLSGRIRMPKYVFCLPLPTTL